ncbi:hypothetical protein D3C77_646260 [compost metagenome]
MAASEVWRAMASSRCCSWLVLKWETTTKATPGFSGMPRKKASNAWIPPADAPRPTMGNSVRSIMSLWPSRPGKQHIGRYMQGKGYASTPGVNITMGDYALIRVRHIARVNPDAFFGPVKTPIQ